MIDVMIVVGVDMLSYIEIIAMTTPVITLGSMVAVVYAVDVLNNLLVTVPIVDIVSATDVDMLADENANGLAAVMTPLEFTLPAPCEEPMPSC